MPRARPCLLLAVGLALACAAWASADASVSIDQLDPPRVADLDGDGVSETVRAHETACFPPGGETEPPCDAGDLRTFFVEVSDSCAAGAVTLRLSRDFDFVSFARVLDADGDGQRRELVFELRAGATGRGVQAKVVRFGSGPSGCVAVARTLFSYPRPDTIGRRPKGTSLATGSLAVRDFSQRFAGLELRTSESYARPTDAGCCPSHRRVTFWRFVAARSGYTPYRTTLKKARRRP
ncbi:MAG: hypothetical protein ACRDLN_14625 [Solirubrobacteraceae bacterium]